MFRRMVFATMAMLAGVLMLGGVAHAQTNSSSSVDYGQVCSVTVTPPNPTAGTQATVAGTDFPANQTFSITLDGTTDLGSVTTDGSGAFSKVVTIPADLAPGSHTISVPCSTTGVEATTTIQVLGATVEQAPLARTGTDVEPLVLVGLGAVALGAAFVLTARRRRAHNAA